MLGGLELLNVARHAAPQKLAVEMIEKADRAIIKADKLAKLLILQTLNFRSCDKSHRVKLVMGVESFHAQGTT
jgi:hypothetical protein